MWALCPPSYHDNDMPIDLRKKVVVERELNEKKEYRNSDNEDQEYAPKDYSLKDRWPIQSNTLPLHNIHPFVSEKYRAKCTVLTVSERENPQDLRPAIRGTLETAIKKLHDSSRLKQTPPREITKEERCKSTDALPEKDNRLKKASRSNSCPDLTSIEQQPTNLNAYTPPSNIGEAAGIKNYSQYSEYSPEHSSSNSPVIGGARKRKSFVPLYGDRAPTYERADRSPSPQNLVNSERTYRSPSPKRPIYVHNGYHSPSPERHIYHERVYRSPSPKRPLYIDRHYYSPSPTTPIYDDRSYHSPSPKRPTFESRHLHSPSPKRPTFENRHLHSPSPKRPVFEGRVFQSLSPKRPVFEERHFRSPSPVRRPKSPQEHPSYEEYFSHPEILLRRQLGHQDTSPYFLHVYDYYQHLVQRLREQSSPTLRINSPVSPPMEDDSQNDAQRKRPCRALTGKHVRQGTGASLSTLLTLRQKIQERQKAKEHEPRTALNGIGNKNTPPKKSIPKKVKINTKNPLGKIQQNC